MWDLCDAEACGPSGKTAAVLQGFRRPVGLLHCRATLSSWQGGKTSSSAKMAWVTIFLVVVLVAGDAGHCWIRGMGCPIAAHQLS